MRCLWFTSTLVTLWWRLNLINILKKSLYRLKIFSQVKTYSKQVHWMFNSNRCLLKWWWWWIHKWVTQCKEWKMLLNSSPKESQVPNKKTSFNKTKQINRLINKPLILYIESYRNLLNLMFKHKFNLKAWMN